MRGIVALCDWRWAGSICVFTGCSAVWLAHLLWEQRVVGSNPITPTFSFSPQLNVRNFRSGRSGMKRISGEDYICKLSKLPSGLFMDETVMDSALYFEDIEIGQIWTSPRRTVTESDVVNFASTTGDFNPLHVDYDFAGKLSLIHI